MRSAANTAKRLTQFALLLVLLNFAQAENATADSSDADEPLLAVPLPTPAEADADRRLPSVVLVTLFRNKAHVLPYYFSFLDALDYPKDRIALWFRSDNNIDETDDVIEAWRQNASAAYHSLNINAIPEPAKPIEATGDNETTEARSPFEWPVERHRTIIDLKQQALQYARSIWADFVFFLDADVLLSDSATLRHLVGQRRPLIAPMLQSDGLYSNFWAGMSDKHYYVRRPAYRRIYERQQIGTFAVPMVHSAVLIDLRDRRTDALTFDWRQLPDDVAANVPEDDIIVLAVAANRSGIGMLVNNERRFGYVTVPLDANDTLDSDRQQLTNLKLQIINDRPADSSLPLLDAVRPFVWRPNADTLDLDAVVVINLQRRPERHAKMSQNLHELGIKWMHLKAVDGSQLTAERLDELGVQVMREYADPYGKRPMTMGEIGCFLSHFWVWELMIERNWNEILVLEDDIMFDTYFKERATHLITEARAIGGYDLLYLGRKRLLNQTEPYVANSKHLVHPSYSYWTLGYIITIEGVRKLLAAKPLEKMLPVDEFLPIMFDQHVNSTWKAHFAERNLVAWSAAPLLIFPTHYTGDEGYVSDTEHSTLVRARGDTGQPDDEDDGDKKGNREQYESPLQTEDANDDDLPATLLHDATAVNDVLLVDLLAVKTEL